ncbi:MAG: Hsp70 family protein [Micrococcaceae bacterium]
MSEEKVVGIDLGTTNSAVAYTKPDGTTEVLAGREGHRIVPSVVHFDDDTTLVGVDAKAMMVAMPDRTASLFKRGMGEETFLPDEKEFIIDGKNQRPEVLSSIVLKKLISNAREALDDENISKAIITVPAYFAAPERKATEKAAEIAGIDVIRLINEPTAAALAHGLENQKKGKYMVFDLGGGTFDITIIDVEADGQITTLATDGDHKLGGADFDDAIFDWAVEELKNEHDIELDTQPGSNDETAVYDLLTRTEDAKKALSSKDATRISITVQGKAIVLKLTREQFEELIADKIEEVKFKTQSAMEDSNIKPSELDGIIMVGGSSRIPVFKDMIQEMTGKEPIFSKNLDEDVARGASMLAAKETTGALDASSMLSALPTPQDAASHGIGVTVLDKNDNEKNQILVNKNDTLPADNTANLSVHRDTYNLQLTVNQGDSEKLDEIIELGKSVGHSEKLLRAGDPLYVKLGYSVDQTIEAKLFDAATDKLITEVKVAIEGEMSDSEKDDAMNFLSSMIVE